MKRLSSSSLVFVLATLITFTACTDKKAPEGFGRSDSPIRYKTTSFDSPDVLAEGGGVKFTREQILDKSPVLKDLDQQLIDTEAALAYQKVAEGDKAEGVVTIYVKPSTEDMSKLLSRLGAEMKPGLRAAFAAPQDESTIASHGDKRYRKDDIGLENFVYRSIEQRKYEEMTQQLNSQASRILLSQEAQNAKVGIQDYIKAKVAKDTSTITPAQVSEYLKSKGINEIELNDRQKEQIAQTLSAVREQKAIEEYVAANILKGPMLVSFTPPQLPLKVSSEFTPIEGYKTAPISVVVFSGTNCPDCLKVVDALEDVTNKYNGFLKLNWIHQYNPNDGLAKMLAEGALCAESQKRGSTLKFLDAVSADGGNFDETKMYGWSKANNINEPEFRDCVIQHKNGELLEKHVAYTQKVGIVSNPTVWVNGEIISGYFDRPTMEKVIQQSIDQSGETKFSAWVRRMKAKFGFEA